MVEGPATRPARSWPTGKNPAASQTDRSIWTPLPHPSSEDPVHDDRIDEAEVAEPFATLVDPDLPRQLASTETAASSGGGFR